MFKSGIVLHVPKSGIVCTWPYENELASYRPAAIQISGSGFSLPVHFFNI